MSALAFCDDMSKCPFCSQSVINVCPLLSCLQLFRFQTASWAVVIYTANHVMQSLAVAVWGLKLLCVHECALCHTARHCVWTADIVSLQFHNNSGVVNNRMDRKHTALFHCGEVLLIMHGCCWTEKCDVLFFWLSFIIYASIIKFMHLNFLFWQVTHVSMGQYWKKLLIQPFMGGKQGYVWYMMGTIVYNSCIKLLYYH